MGSGYGFDVAAVSEPFSRLTPFRSVVSLTGWLQVKRAPDTIETMTAVVGMGGMYWTVPSA